MTDALPAPLPPFLPEALRREASAVALQRGGKLFHCGERVSHIHFVVAGELLAVRYLRDGSEAVMQRARGGEFFAQSAMLVPHYSCDARAACASEIVRLPVEALRDTLAADGRFALAFAGQMAADLRRQCTRVERLRIKRARDRVRHYLVCEGPLAADARLQDWAHELGLEPETLYRALAELETGGEIVREGRAVRLAANPPAAPSCAG
ncbi:MAG: Crp/Fnr family transcriptional regulator [Rubrivivax sp.]|nr:Crp/Fnr family transcriptional regulator [Rubrivivax sp.]